MKKQILSELNRFREIIGLPLLNEGIVPLELLESLAKAFGKNEEQFIESLGKGEMVAIEKVFDDLADVTGRNASDLINDFKLDKLTDDVEDLFVVKMIQSNTPSIVEAAVKSYTKTKPVLVNLVNNTLKGIDSVISKASDKSYNEYLENVKNLIDNSGLPQATINYLKKDFMSNATSIRAKKVLDPSKILTPEEITSKKFDDLYTIYKNDVELANKVPKTREEFETLARAYESQGIDALDIVEYLLSKTKNKENFVKKIKTGFGITGDVLDASGNVAVGASKKIAEASSFWTTKKVIAAMTVLFGGTVVYLLWNPEAIADYSQKVKEAGSKYNDVYNGLLQNLGKNFADLPEDVKQFLSRTLTSKDITKGGTDPYVVNITYIKSPNQYELGSLVVTKSDDSKIEFIPTNSEDKDFKRKGETKGEVGTSKTEEEFKAAAMNGGFDVGKSFEKKSDTKYWGIDNDDSESTTEWNGTTFIVTSGHI